MLIPMPFSRISLSQHVPLAMRLAQRSASSVICPCTASKYLTIPACPSAVSSRNYAAAASSSPSISSKVIGEKEDKGYVESDAKKLANYVCVNYLVQGEDPGPPIKPNSEYPEWLFRLELRKPRELEDLDPEKDGWLYWRALRHRQEQQARRHKYLKYRFVHIQDSPSVVKAKKKKGERPLW